MAVDIRTHFEIAANYPAGWHEDYFTNQYGNRLRYSYSPSPLPSAKGTVILTHGYGEFIELYSDAIREYQRMGFNVWAMDFYGFGKSGRDNPHAPHTPSTKGLLRHVKDMDFFIRNVVKRERRSPLILSTASMGGHIGLLYLERHPRVFDGAVMSSPMFDIYRFGMPKAFRPLFRLFFRCACRLGYRDVSIPPLPAFMDKIDRVGTTLTASERAGGGVHQAINQMIRGAMPETEVDRPTFGWLAAASKTIVSSTKANVLKRVKTPVLIGSAGFDHLVAISEHKRAARIMPHATLVELPTAHHGLWFEDNGNYIFWVKSVRKFVRSVLVQYDLAHGGSGRNSIPNNLPGPKSMRGKTAAKQVLIPGKPALFDQTPSGR